MEYSQQCSNFGTLVLFTALKSLYARCLVGPFIVHFKSTKSETKAKQGWPNCARHVITNWKAVADNLYFNKKESQSILVTTYFRRFNVSCGKQILFRWKSKIIFMVRRWWKSTGLWLLDLKCHWRCHCKSSNGRKWRRRLTLMPQICDQRVDVHRRYSVQLSVSAFQLFACLNRTLSKEMSAGSSLSRTSVIKTHIQYQVDHRFRQTIYQRAVGYLNFIISWETNSHLGLGPKLSLLYRKTTEQKLSNLSEDHT